MYYGGIPQLGRLFNLELLFGVFEKSKFRPSTLFYTQNKTNGIPLLNDPWMAARNGNGMKDGDKT